MTSCLYNMLYKSYTHINVPHNVVFALHEHNLFNELVYFLLYTDDLLSGELIYLTKVSVRGLDNNIFNNTYP